MKRSTLKKLRRRLLRLLHQLLIIFLVLGSWLLGGAVLLYYDSVITGSWTVVILIFLCLVLFAGCLAFYRITLPAPRARQSSPEFSKRPENGGGRGSSVNLDDEFKREINDVIAAHGGVNSESLSKLQDLIDDANQGLDRLCETGVLVYGRIIESEDIYDGERGVRFTYEYVAKNGETFRGAHKDTLDNWTKFEDTQRYYRNRKPGVRVPILYEPDSPGRHQINWKSFY